MSPQVLNRRRRQGNAGSVYVGRPTRWGNPFEIGPDGTREEVIAKYEEAITGNPGMIAAAQAELRGRDLECWCAPLPCHADVLLRLANS